MALATAEFIPEIRSDYFVVRPKRKDRLSAVFCCTIFVSITQMLLLFFASDAIATTPCPPVRWRIEAAQPGAVSVQVHPARLQ